MTVQELIDQLSKFPKDAKVVVDDEDNWLRIHPKIVKMIPGHNDIVILEDPTN